MSQMPVARMQTFGRIVASALLVLAMLAPPARARELAGATLPDTLQVGDKQLGVWAGKGFADAVFAIWLGPTPPSDDLKHGMLG